MRIHIITSAPRRRPKVGDLRTVRGVEQVRVLRRVSFGPYRGAQVVSGSRPCFDWVPVDSDEATAAHL